MRRPGRMQCVQRRWRAVLDRIGHGSAARPDDARRPPGTSRWRLRARNARQCSERRNIGAGSRISAAFAEGADRARRRVRARRCRSRTRSPRRRSKQSPRARFGHDRLGQRMLAALLEAGRQPQHLVGVEIPPCGRDDRAERRAAFGQGAGLVDDQRVDQRSRSIASASRNSTPACAARPVATMIDIGVARPSAQGQAMISTDTALTTA
jgi:hypothetical protein